MLLQLLFIVVYTIIISILAPQHWLHPFGPISKNIPLLALTFLTYKEQKSL
ncbi:MAG: hypothetical protein IPG29_11030 [Sphingobacteriales bacterium]|nr:hypothetical protein [Sphingobacteriales bacterium]